MLQLPEKIKVINKDGHKAVFEISPLMPGYGATIANPLRRVLLSSLTGTAITSIKIKGVDHEFSSVPGVLEDLIEIILNVKKIRLKSYSNDPLKLNLSVSGEKEVKAKDIKLTSDVELINGDQHIATITDKKASLEMELEIEKGIGYVPVEQRRKDKLAIGVIAIDAIFSPVKSVNFSVEDIRVGQRIDFNKVVITVETDGSIQPEKAIKDSAEILIDHFKTATELKIPEENSKAKIAKPSTAKTKKVRVVRSASSGQVKTKIKNNK
jgi:DNA-directed RNA polymerase subunit alpha